MLFKDYDIIKEDICNNSISNLYCINCLYTLTAIRCKTKFTYSAPCPTFDVAHPFGNENFSLWG
jgi:hypothetical protein